MLLVAYDIPDDHRRTRVMKALARRGRRIQYSVFLLPNGDATEVAAELRSLVVPEEDNIRIHPLCAACQARSVLLGTATSQSTAAGAFRLI